jgi:hypothetical protein
VWVGSVQVGVEAATVHVRQREVEDRVESTVRVAMRVLAGQGEEKLAQYNNVQLHLSFLPCILGLVKIKLDKVLLSILIKI